MYIIYIYISWHDMYIHILIVNLNSDAYCIHVWKYISTHILTNQKKLTESIGCSERYTNTIIPVNLMKQKKMFSVSLKTI